MRLFFVIINNNGKFRKNNPGYNLRHSQDNIDRAITILEEVITDTVDVEHSPSGYCYDKPKKILLRDWVKEAFKNLLLMGGFYNPKGDFVEASESRHKTHIDHVIKTAKELKELSIIDMQYLAKYKRDGLLENPELTLVKKHFKNCNNVTSILDVYAPQFALRGYQREFPEIEADIKAIEGGRGRGGSHAGIPSLILPAMGSPVPVVVTAARKDKASLRPSVWISILALLSVPEFFLMVKGGTKGINRSQMTVEFINGSRFVAQGYHTDQQRGASKGVGHSESLGGEVWISLIEELTDGITREDWDTIVTNTRHKPKGCRRPCVMPLMNPGPPNHWFKTDIIDNELIETTPQGGKIVKLSENRTALIYSKTAKDNEWLMENNPEYWEQLQSIKSPTLKARLAYGEWKANEGVVYSEFDELTHVISIPDFDPINELKKRDGGYIIMGGDGGARDASFMFWGFVRPLIQKQINSKNTIKTWSLIIYRQFYMWNCNRGYLPKFIDSFPDSKMASALIWGHDGVSEIDGFKRLGLKATHNQNKKKVGEYQKETIAEFINTAIGEGRFHILEDSLLDNNDSSKVPQNLKLLDYKEPEPGQPTSIETEFPTVKWGVKVVDGVKVPTGKIKDGNDHASDGVINGVKYIQHIIDRNNQANILKGMKILSGGR